MSIPKKAEGRFQIDVFDLAGTEPDARSKAARFLMRTTFGPTRKGIEEFLGKHEGSAEAWIKDQMVCNYALMRRRACVPVSDVWP